ncbi:MAG: hypothetical protein OEU46_11335 [Alphaproteobacteria bacterium]|nr:hypothetical protein [Alphaproteobacteria bacterium]
MNNRTRLSLDQLLTIEEIAAWHSHEPTVIQKLFERWKEKAGYFGELPDPAAFSRDCIIDTTADDPLSYKLPNYTGCLTSWRGLYISEFPLKEHAFACAVEYWECKESRQPSAHYFKQDIDNVVREYFRLLLPLAGDRLVYAYRSIVGPIVPSRHKFA